MSVGWAPLWLSRCAILCSSEFWDFSRDQLQVVVHTAVHAPVSLALAVIIHLVQGHHALPQGMLGLPSLASSQGLQLGRCDWHVSSHDSQCHPHLYHVGISYTNKCPYHLFIWF